MNDNNKIYEFKILFVDGAEDVVCVPATSNIEARHKLAKIEKFGMYIKEIQWIN